MSDALQKELKKFDAERVLPTWDKLVRGQQARLEALKVPAMFVTNDPSDMAVRTSHLHVKCNLGSVLTLHGLSAQNQHRVVNVLEGILPTRGAA